MFKDFLICASREKKCSGLAFLVRKDLVRDCNGCFASWAGGRADRLVLAGKKQLIIWNIHNFDLKRSDLALLFAQIASDTSATSYVAP